MTILLSALTGGLLCLLAQILINKTKLTPARILTGCVLVGVLLGTLGVYEPFAHFARSGASVPLTGFGYLLAKGAKEAVAKDGFWGIFLGGVKASAGGVTAAIVCGVVASFVTKMVQKMNKK